MSDPPPGPGKDYGGPPENRSGPGPVSQPGFDRIVSASEVERREHPKGTGEARRRSGHFSPWTWVMIVIAGLVLGVALAMMAAGA